MEASSLEKSIAYFQQASSGFEQSRDTATWLYAENTRRKARRVSVFLIGVKSKSFEVICKVHAKAKVLADSPQVRNWILSIICVKIQKVQNVNHLWLKM